MPKLGMEPLRRAALVDAAIVEVGAHGTQSVTVGQIARPNSAAPRTFIIQATCGILEAKRLASYIHHHHLHPPATSHHPSFSACDDMRGKGKPPPTQELCCNTGPDGGDPGKATTGVVVAEKMERA